MKLGEIMMDPALAKDGAWCTYMGDMKFKIRRANGTSTIECMQKLMEPHVAQGVKSLEDLPEDKQQSIENQVLAEAILCGWENMEGPEGESIPYSVDKAVEILAMPEAVALKEWIQYQSMAFDTFRAKAAEEASGN